MKNQDFFKKILELTRSRWDSPLERKCVRDSYRKVCMCRTPELGAEVYASELGSRIVNHTCKSKSCPSCGNRGTLLWQREQWVTLPDIAFKSVIFTMPDVFWPIFKDHRHLEHDLSALGAAVIQEWAWTNYRVKLYVMVIQQTFGGLLNYNPHLHMMVSVGGLKFSQCRWVKSISFCAQEIRDLWRFAVTEYLRKAKINGLLNNISGLRGLGANIRYWSSKDWNIFITGRMTKDHFLKYAGRYIRRPPFSNRSILSVTAQQVVYKAKDTRAKAIVTKRCTPEAFIALVSQHVPQHYRHSMRYFGLLAPRSKRQTRSAVFFLLVQSMRQKPRRQPWNLSILKAFGVDPLLDASGHRMKWVGHQRPVLLH